MLIIFTLLLSLCVYGQSAIFYVSSNGVDDSSCGSQSSACASINQVIINYPGVSCTISIGSGTFLTTAITLQNAFLIFQGAGNPTITTAWRSGPFIINVDAAGFEFHDLSIAVSGGGSSFTTTADLNTIGFYNVTLGFSEYTAWFAQAYGGTVVVSNVTLNGTSIDDEFIFDASKKADTNVTIVKSTFSNLKIGGGGMILNFYSDLGTKIALIDSSNFTNITAENAFTSFLAADAATNVSITNSIFDGVDSEYSAIYFWGGYFDCTLYVDSTVFNAVSSDFIGGAIGIYPEGMDIDPNITINNVTATNCTGSEAGAFSFPYGVFVLSNCTFAGNWGEYGKDIQLTVERGSVSYAILASCSSSRSPQAVLRTLSGDLVDISDLLDDCPSNRNRPK